MPNGVKSAMPSPRLADGMVMPEHFSQDVAKAERRIEIDAIDLPPELAVVLAQENLESAVEALERVFVSRALDRYRGNITHAAKALGLSRQGLLLKKKRLGFD